MQDKLVTEKSQKAALEHMLQEEKDLMESVVCREMEKAASLQVDLATARQQKALSRQLMQCGCTSRQPFIRCSMSTCCCFPGVALRGYICHQLCTLSWPSCISEPNCNPQGEAQAAKERVESRLAEAERTARRAREELDSRAARLEAQLHQQALDTDAYRRRSEAEIRQQQQVVAMTEQANR